MVKKKITKSLKAAVIGLGRIGFETTNDQKISMPKGWLPYNHVEAINATRNVELVCACEKNKKFNNHQLSFLSKLKIYKDYKTLLKKEKVDIITIATRSDVRSQIMETAIDYGIKGILAEKPFTQSLKETKKILSKLKKNKVLLSYGVYRRYAEPYKNAKIISDSGELGDLKQISIFFGNTHLLWNLTHAVDLLIFFSNAKSALWANGIVEFQKGLKIKNNFIDDDPIVKSATIMFDNGIIGSITSGGGLSVKLSFSKGEIEIGADGTWLNINKKNQNIKSPYYYDRRNIISQPSKSGMQLAIENLRDQIIYKKKSLITNNDILEGQRILYSLVLSEINNGSRFFLKDVPEQLIITGKIKNKFA